jgi:hypothetical protein
MGVGGQHHAPAALPTGKRPVTHCTGGWVGPRASMEGTENLAPPEFDPRAVQPVASRYTDDAIPSHFSSTMVSVFQTAQSPVEKSRKTWSWLDFT